MLHKGGRIKVDIYASSRWSSLLLIASCVHNLLSCMFTKPSSSKGACNWFSTCQLITALLIQRILELSSMTSQFSGSIISSPQRLWQCAFTRQLIKALLIHHTFTVNIYDRPIDCLHQSASEVVLNKCSAADHIPHPTLIHLRRSPCHILKDK